MEKNNMTEMQTLWEWIDANCHEESFNINNAREISIQREREQRIKDYNAGYQDAECNHINDAENYINESEYMNQKDDKPKRIHIERSPEWP